jgi:hypothetical protein
MSQLHNIGLAKMQTESRTILDGEWPQFTEKAERPIKSHRFGKPSFAALTVQLCGDQPKQTDSRKAIEVARKWEKAARLAANSELTQSASIRLLDELMEVTIGEHLDVQSVETYIEQWLRSKKATGTNSGTLSRYEPVLEGFLQSVSEKRRRTSQLKCCVRSSIQRGGVAFVQAIRLRASKCCPRRARSGCHSPKIK